MAPKKNVSRNLRPPTKAAIRQLEEKVNFNEQKAMEANTVIKQEVRATPVVKVEGERSNTEETLIDLTHNEEMKTTGSEAPRELEDLQKMADSVIADMEGIARDAERRASALKGEPNSSEEDVDPDEPLEPQDGSESGTHESMPGLTDSSSEECPEKRQGYGERSETTTHDNALADVLSGRGLTTRLGVGERRSITEEVSTTRRGLTRERAAYAVPPPHLEDVDSRDRTREINNVRIGHRQHWRNSLPEEHAISPVYTERWLVGPSAGEYRQRVPCSKYIRDEQARDRVAAKQKYWDQGLILGAEEPTFPTFENPEHKHLHPDAAELYDMVFTPNQIRQREAWKATANTRLNQRFFRWLQREGVEIDNPTGTWTKELIFWEYDLMLLEMGQLRHAKLVGEQRSDFVIAEREYADEESRLWRQYYNTDRNMWKKLAPYYLNYLDGPESMAGIEQERAISAIVASYPGPDPATCQASDTMRLYTTLCEGGHLCEFLDADVADAAEAVAQSWQLYERHKTPTYKQSWVSRCARDIELARSRGRQLRESYPRGAANAGTEHVSSGAWSPSQAPATYISPVLEGRRQVMGPSEIGARRERSASTIPNTPTGSEDRAKATPRKVKSDTKSLPVATGGSSDGSSSSSSSSESSSSSDSSSCDSDSAGEDRGGRHKSKREKKRRKRRGKHISRNKRGRDHGDSSDDGRSGSRHRDDRYRSPDPDRGSPTGSSRDRSFSSDRQLEGSQTSSAQRSETPVRDTETRKANIAGPYTALTRQHDRDEDRDRRTGRSKKSPDMSRFRDLKLQNLELENVVKFLHDYEDARGRHPDIIFKMTAFLGEEAMVSLQLEAAKASWDLTQLPGNSVAHLDDTDVRKLLHKKVAAKSIDDFVTKVRAVKFTPSVEKEGMDVEAYTFGELLDTAMKYQLRFCTLAEIIAVEAKEEHLPFVHKREQVRGLIDYFIDGWPLAKSGTKTIGRLLYEKIAYSHPELKATRVLRSWMYEFFKILLPYRELKQMADDLNSVILRHDLVGKSFTSRVVYQGKTPVSEANMAVSKGKSERLTHVTFAPGSDSQDEAQILEPASDEEIQPVNAQAALDEMFNITTDAPRANGCHRKFQFGKCSDNNCKLDHTEEGIRRVYMKRVWELAKAAHRPDSASVMRNVKHALEEIDSKNSRENA